MSAEYAGKRQRVGGDDSAAADLNQNSATSSVDLESMLKQALGRIESLEWQHEEMKTSMESETKSLREDICRLKEENKTLKSSTERQIESLSDDINSLQSEHKALKWSLNRLASKVREGWEYPVAIQPYEYWENKGYDDQNHRDLFSFLQELKEAVSSLEHGVCQPVNVLYADPDEDLMPHWNALFRSFDYINPYGAGVKLCFVCILLNEELMRQICHHVRHRNISQVRFENIWFTNIQGAISEIGKALKSPKLKSLEWRDNNIDSTEDMSLFMRVLSQSDAVDKLAFRNGNKNTRALLSGADFSTYKVLNLGGNNLQTNRSTDIPDLIAANPPLETLHLGGNKLNDNDAVLIAQSLGRNTHLSLLDLENNNIQARGMRALYEAVNDTSTLNALSDSNHSCLIEGLSGDFDLESVNVQDGPNGLHLNRMCKIHKLMRGEGPLASDFTQDQKSRPLRYRS